MAIPINEFWKLAIAAQVFSREEAQQLHQTFAATPGAAKHANSVTLAEWLIAQSMLSRYHAKMLLAGKTGPCVVGQYKIFDCVSSGPLKGVYRAANLQTGAGVMLFGIDPPLNPAAGAAANQVAASQLFQAKHALRAPVLDYVQLDSGAIRCWLVLDDTSASVAAQPEPATTPVNKTAPLAAPTAQQIKPAPAVVANRPLAMPATARSAAVNASNAPVIVEKKTVGIEQPFVVQQTTSAGASPALAAYAARRRKSVPWMPIAGAAALMAAMGFGVYLLSQSGTAPDDHRSLATRRATSPPSTTSVGATNGSSGGVESSGGRPTPPKPTQVTVPSTTLVEDDGQTLWAAPTQGPPVDMRYVAPGAQLFLVVRPSSLLGTEEGERVFAALGPWGETAVDWAQRNTGFPLSEIERVMVAWYPSDGDIPLASYVVTLRQAADEAKLLQAWHQPQAVERRGRRYFAGTNFAYYVPQSAGGRVFAIAPPALMEEIAGSDGPPLLRKEMEKLLRDTDDTRHVNLLLYPNFLFADGATFLSGSLRKLKGPLKDYFGEGIQAATLSLHLTGDDSFYELRTMGTIDVSTIERANLYRQRLQDLPVSVESYLAELNPQKYGSMILIRMPRMIGELANYTRVGEENGQSVLRCYLPAVAAHNLVLATELALAEQPGGVVVASSAGPAQPAAPKSLADKLKQKISLSFPRNTLEKCMEMLGEELLVPVEILGADLQLEGITKNQSFGLDERDLPAEEILQKVMLLANPDGKLVYVIKPGADGAERLIITTRAAVEKRGDKLPDALVQPAAGK